MRVANMVKMSIIAASMTTGYVVNASVGVVQNGIWSLDTNGDKVWEPPPGVPPFIGYPNDDSRYSFGGSPGDIPVVVGFLEGPGAAITMFNSGYWSIDANLNGVWDGTAGGDWQFKFGNAGDTPLGTTTVTSINLPVLSVYNSGTWSFDTNNDKTFDTGDVQLSFGGSPGDQPVVGDWAGDFGQDCMGIYNNGTWSLDWNCDGKWEGPAGGDVQFKFGGSPGDQPVVGVWQENSGQTCVGIFNAGTWSLDLNCNEVFDDPQFSFGSANDAPLVVVGINAIDIR